VLGSLEVCPTGLTARGPANSLFAVAEQAKEQETQQRRGDVELPMNN